MIHAFIIIIIIGGGGGTRSGDRRDVVMLDAGCG